jgi:thiol-disulfide isomerase/thioredoxin
MKRLSLLALLLLAQSVMAADLKPFHPASRTAIEQAHASQPFVLAFWSVDCAYCPEEIRHLGALVRKRPDIRLVLVSVDGMEMKSEVGTKLAEYLPDGKGERWIFAADDPARLYFAIDRKWHGELPRTYFYDGKGGVRSMTGQVDAAWLANWARGVDR